MKDEEEAQYRSKKMREWRKLLTRQKFSVRFEIEESFDWLLLILLEDISSPRMIDVKIEMVDGRDEEVNNI